MVRLASFAQVLHAIARARSVDLRSYLLQRGGPVARALAAAAQRGASVAVRLDRAPYGPQGNDLGRNNHRVGRELARAGCRVVYGHPLHAKELRVDGRRYLDECNWNRGDFVVRDDRDAHLVSHKRDALAQEAVLLANARNGDDVIVESERFDERNAVFKQLERLGRAGAHVRLLLSRAYAASPHEQTAVARLQNEGVEVRFCKYSEKFAIAGDRAWLGSANATIDYGAGDPSDWGTTTRSASVVRALRDRLDERWTKGKSPGVAAKG